MEEVKHNVTGGPASWQCGVQMVKPLTMRMCGEGGRGARQGAGDPILKEVLGEQRRPQGDDSSAGV